MSFPPIPMTTVYYSGNKTKREYTHEIDFIPLSKKEGIRGQVMFSFPMQRQVELFNSFLNKQLLFHFVPKIRIIQNTSPKMLWIRLQAKKECVGSDATMHLRTLLASLKENPDIKIIWKEGDFGYEIDSFGKIKRKWKLCPF